MDSHTSSANLVPLSKPQRRLNFALIVQSFGIIVSVIAAVAAYRSSTAAARNAAAATQNAAFQTTEDIKVEALFREAADGQSLLITIINNGPETTVVRIGFCEESNEDGPAHKLIYENDVPLKRRLLRSDSITITIRVKDYDWTRGIRIAEGIVVESPSSRRWRTDEKSSEQVKKFVAAVKKRYEEKK